MAIRKNYEFWAITKTKFKVHGIEYKLNNVKALITPLWDFMEMKKAIHTLDHGLHIMIRADKNTKNGNTPYVVIKPPMDLQKYRDALDTIEAFVDALPDKQMVYDHDGVDEWEDS